MYMKKICCLIWPMMMIFFQTAFCQVRLPRLISDGMILQRDARVKIWGWAASGEKVSVKFIDSTYAATAGTDGKWEVVLPPLKAGGPCSMEIHASNNIIIKNILVGDVWVCSGQSNMVLPMSRVKDLYGDIIAHSDNPGIRQFLVPMKYDFKISREDVDSGKWEPANSVNVLHFTAAGYFFARTLYERYKVPIGLINASVGGTPIEAWISNEALRAFPASLEIVDKFRDSVYLDRVSREDKAASFRWYSCLHQLDNGLNSEGKPWYDTTFDASGWSSMHLPAYWEDEGLGRMNGVVWFRKEIDVPVSMTGKPARLQLGRIVDADSVYVNGVFTGTTSYQYPPRDYTIPPQRLKVGKNIIVVRVISTLGRGGFVKDKPYQLSTDGQVIDLKGEWKFKIGATVNPLADPTFIQYQPTGLYNGMISPLLNYPIKGVIWYQGESNVAKAVEYQKLFPTMINDWRRKWDQGDFPFLYVQLHNYLQVNDQPSESNWARLREAQLKTLVVPNTAMAVAIDIGEWNDIHPLNKKEVGRRLALAAQKLAYHDPAVVSSGPLYESMSIIGNKVAITFSNIGSGLCIKDGGELKYFAIAGADKKYVWAHAKIEDNKVIVWNNQVISPRNVRYAWADNPDGANLYNKEGLPASPFRTDR